METILLPLAIRNTAAVLGNDSFFGRNPHHVIQRLVGEALVFRKTSKDDGKLTLQLANILLISRSTCMVVLTSV